MQKDLISLRDPINSWIINWCSEYFNECIENSFINTALL